MRCHVEPGAASCLQCSVPDDCVFERLIVTERRLPDFAWSDLIGQTSTIRRQSGSTGFTAQEPLNSPALPVKREISPQSLEDLPQADDPPLSAPRADSWALPDDALSADGQLSSRQTQTPEPEVRAQHAGQTVRSTPSGVVHLAGPTIRSSELKRADCGYRARTRAELSHKRDHKCTFPGCPRVQKGFLSGADLDRHLYGVHNINNRNARSYMCFGKDCSKPDKEFRLLVHFRTHIKRMHPEESAATLIQQSNYWYDRQFDSNPEHYSHESLEETEDAAATPLSIIDLTQPKWTLAPMSP
ncbi:hypothetical protein CLAIMM_01677 [Cladophialophora immunda]|nr:hypothetical protein CLAIMM_01677 [Cladophialophora immunda]